MAILAKRKYTAMVQGNASDQSITSSDAPPADSPMLTKPLLRWAGGKRALAARLAAVLPELDSISRYFEPFLGAGSLFFRIAPRLSTLGDHNERLMSMYAAVRDNPREVSELLDIHRASHGQSHYYSVRDTFNENDGDRIEQAARFIYLNSAGYNGVFRVNQQGKYNVPFGRKDAHHIPTLERVETVSKALRDSVLVSGDFAATVAGSESSDFVYFDPPYPPLSDTAYFEKYTAAGFGSKEHDRLACLFWDLTERGVKTLLSISDTPEVRKMYHGARIIELKATRHVSCKKSKLLVNELAIVNYDI